MATAFRKSQWGTTSKPCRKRASATCSILKSGPDPRQPWTAREIDRVPTVHRLRWIDLAGDGKKVLLVAPMIGLKAQPPDYADNVPVYLYRPGESGNASCSPTCRAAFSTASRRSAGRGAANNS